NREGESREGAAAEYAGGGVSESAAAGRRAEIFRAGAGNGCGVCGGAGESRNCADGTAETGSSESGAGGGEGEAAERCVCMVQPGTGVQGFGGSGTRGGGFYAR